MGCIGCLRFVNLILLFLRATLGSQVAHAASVNTSVAGANPVPVFYHFRHRRHHARALEPSANVHEEDAGGDARAQDDRVEKHDRAKKKDESADDKRDPNDGRGSHRKDESADDKRAPKDGRVRKDDPDEKGDRTEKDKPKRATTEDDEDDRLRPAVATCGGNQDTQGKKQLERENGKGCVFPFEYLGRRYNECIEVDSPGKPWCQTSGKEMEERGMVRWGFCNPEGKPCPPSFQDDPVDVGRNGAIAESSKKLQDDEYLIARWFAWEVWKPLVIIVAILFLFSELIGPALETKAGQPSFMTRSLVFAAQMTVTQIAAYFLARPGLAATHHILGIISVNWALSVVLLISGICIRMRSLRIVSSVMDDSSVFLSLYTRFVMVALLVYGIIDETEAQYASVAGMAGLFALGLAMASSGVFQDYVAYLYIRFDDVFEEDDVVNVSGERVVRVRRITVRHIEVESFDDAAPHYIPNRTITGDCIVNLTRDTGRLECTSIPLEASIPAKRLEAIVQGVHLIFKSSADGFNALNGNRYPCQFDIESCHAYIGEMPAGGKDVRQIKLNLRLRGKYWYSNPPPWNRGGEEPDAKIRDMEWFMPWQFQKEWFYLEVQKLLENQEALGL